MQEFQHQKHFEDVMDMAVEAHNLGLYEVALTLGEEAYKMAPQNSSYQGRAARDISARYDRLGWEYIDNAEEYARKAYRIHDDIVRSKPDREAYRQRSVSAMYLAVNGLRRAIKNGESCDGDNAKNAVNLMRMTAEDIKTAKMSAPKLLDRLVDQYEINASRRISMTESLYGNRKKGLMIGAKAVYLAFWSESPKMDTGNPNLSLAQRLQVKSKALIGGISALGINILASPKENKRRSFSLRLVNKAL